ncbi:MAG: cation:proton antiporter [Candidatus Sericytochromatia bacterium]|nr:cation:proton antiporter [Candidatus Sericytochromatia bacterium]
MDGAIAMGLVLLAAVTAVTLLAGAIRVPYSTALVLAGVLLGHGGWVPAVALGPEVVLGVFLPILLFEASITTNAAHLREDWLPVGLLSTAGVFASAAVTAALVGWGLGLPGALAALLGVMFSITDTVAVLAVFRSLQVPRRLVTIVEGESLFNDGVTLVLFKVVLAVVVTGVFRPFDSVLDIVAVSAGGIALGALLGGLGSLVLRQARSHLSEIAVSVLMALGTYHTAERLHVSGVIAVVVAGLVVGNWAWRRALEPSSQIAMRSFWEFAAFGVNSAVFLLVGLNIHPDALLRHAPAIAACLGAIHVGRAVTVYGGFRLLARSRMRPVPGGWEHVFVWGNIKGSLTMVLALSLPAAVPQRDLVVTVTVGVVLVSLLLQGVSLGPLIARLGLVSVSGLQRAFEVQQLALIQARAAQAEIAALADAGIVSRGAFERLRSRYQVAIARAERELRRLATENPSHMDRSLEVINHRVHQVEKAAVMRALGEGLVSEEVGGEALLHLDRLLVETEPASGAERATPEGPA